MSKRMLIDANHPEETRVVVLSGQKVEEFDFEAASKRPLKGNIYLAKVTRVEPSLQAAFVEYGGNRQGFLAFAEIHPDYYQIPVADRQALLAEQEAEARRRQEDDIESFDISARAKDEQAEAGDESDEEEEEDAEAEDGAEEGAEPKPRPTGAALDVSALPASGDEDASEDEDETESLEAGAADHDDEHEHEHDDHAGEEDEDHGHEEGHDDAMHADSGEEAADDAHEADDAAEGETQAEGGEAKALKTPRAKQKFLRKKHYKIQEVIKRRQIILVQVVKEERGNKGAALTTYLSLAGRYCVLMPNTPRGGGISRKITDAGDRKRLKSAAQSLELPEGMGLIIRTAGENRTKVEIRRDYEYLLRMWDTIRETTLNSIAPACVYEEGDLIKRAIRDLYNKDVGEIVVEGEAGYRNAKDFMRMLMPSHAKNVKLYNEPAPLFQRFQIEAQLDAMFTPTVTLRSGGYLVINQTEALVSIDVNSGRATREHSIEETAYKTNLEAAEEIGRQLRLRDLAGLVVIDFIDMEEGRHDREVEKRLRDAVKNDRARVQIGKISQFGLLEMSRQRLRAGVVAGSTIPCPHCSGTGLIRSVESASLRVLRALEEEGQKRRAAAVTVRVAGDVALYTLNQKRKELARIESEYGLDVSFEPKDDLPAGAFDVERTKQRDPSERKHIPSMGEPVFITDAEDENIVEEPDEDAEDENEAQDADAPREARADGEDHGDGRKRRRRRRRGGRGRNRERGEPHHGDEQPHGEGAQRAQAEGAESAADDAAEDAEAGAADQAGGEHQAGDGEGGRRRRRRRRRGGRGRNREHGGEEQAEAAPGFSRDPGSYDRFGHAPDEIDTTPRENPLPAPNSASEPVWSLSENAAAEAPGADAQDATGTPKRGWWQRAFKP